MKKITLENGNVILVDWNLIGHLAGWIETLTRASTKLKGFGVLAPLIYDQNGKIFSTAGFISPNLVVPLFNGMGERNYGQYPGTRECDVVSLKLALISKDLIKEIGLPENPGADIFEDSNYCLQAAAHGFKNYYTDELSVQLLREQPSFGEERDQVQKLSESATLFKERWGGLVAKNYQYPVMFSTTVDSPSGFARAARGYIRGLTEIGVKLHYQNLLGVPEEEDFVADELVNDVREAPPRMDIPQIVWGQAPLFFKNSGKYKIGFSEFEGEPIPYTWVKYLNMMDEVWVPTEWNKKLYRKAGVYVPIHIFHQGIDPDYFYPGIAPMQFDAPEKYKFICNAAWEPRKNLKNLIIAFTNEFKRDENVCLIIKTANMGLCDSIKDEVAAIKTPKDGAHVYVREQVIPDEELGSFYTAGDVFVLPTRGEAWGLPIFEALACGLPVITTGVGAPNEVLRDKKGKPLPGVHFVDSRPVRAVTRYVYMEGTSWADPLIPDLKKKMRHVYDNLDKERALALKTSKIVRNKFSWRNVSLPIRQRLKEIYEKGF
jgi:glycosyltransferase involved in cell wall biosynthesis